VTLLDQGELAHHHLRLASAFETTAQPDPEALAIHYYGAGDLPLAAKFAVRAAVRATHALAFERAAGLYRMALEVLPNDRHLLISLGDALANGGRGAEAADAYLAAVAAATSDAEILDLRCRASWQLLASGHIDRGLNALDQVLRAVNLAYPSTPRRALASVVWGRLRLGLRGLAFRHVDEREVPASRLAQIDALFAAAQLLGMAEVVRSADFHVRSLRLALSIGEPRRVARALAAEAVFVSLAGTRVTDRAEGLLRRLRLLATELGDPATRGLTAGAEAMTAFNLGRFRATIDHAVEAERIFRDECTGFHWEISTSQLFQSFGLALTGRISEMIHRFPALMKEASERGNLYAATSFKACLGFYIPLANDDPAWAYREVDEAMERWSAIGYHLQHLNALHSRLCVDIYSQRGRRALERCDGEWRQLSRSLLLRTQTLRVLMWGGRARAALAAHEEGAGDQVLQIVERVARMLMRERAPYCVAQAELLRAGLAFRRGDREGAAAALARGTKLAADSELLMNAMCSTRAHGVILGGDEGASLVREADEFFTSQGLSNPAAVARIFAPGFGQ
jgi:tetratricopeptide (TPR) repeat protein